MVCLGFCFLVVIRRNWCLVFKTVAILSVSFDYLFSSLFFICTSFLPKNVLLNFLKNLLLTFFNVSFRANDYIGLSFWLELIFFLWLLTYGLEILILQRLTELLLISDAYFLFIFWLPSSYHLYWKTLIQMILFNNFLLNNLRKIFVQFI